ncbi:MAG: hypothetical protein VR75_00235 [Hyphomonadaceae bacterium BRH_c29]|nr:MAG: hypothetical protein VR75_00235 [Hyphomonadaceae bacterium BRH_c29]
MARSSILVGFNDLKRSIVKFPVAAAMARDDLVIRFERTILGPLWLPLSNIVFIAGLTIVFGTLFKVDVATYVVYLASGLMIWNFVSSVLTSSPNYFVQSQAIMEAYALPWSLQIIRHLLSQIFLMSIHFAIWVIIALIFKHPFTTHTPFALLGIGIVFVLAYGVALTLATLGARYRDLKFAIESVLPFFFLLTPVFWRAADLPGERPAVTTFNPLFHVLSIVRDPLLNKSVEPLSWIVSGALAVFFLLVGITMFVRGRRRLLLWM